MEVIEEHDNKSLNKLKSDENLLKIDDETNNWNDFVPKEEFLKIYFENLST